MAITLKPFCIKNYKRKLTEEQQMNVVLRDPKYIRFIKEPTNKVKAKAIELEPLVKLYF